MWKEDSQRDRGDTWWWRSKKEGSVQRAVQEHEKLNKECGCKNHKERGRKEDKKIV